jgi:hypothetical protein
VNNRQLFVTNDGGVAVTDNATAPVSTGLQAACGPTTPQEVPWRELNNGLGTLQFYTGAVNATGSVFLGRAQDNGTHLRFAAQPPEGWSHIFGGDGASVAIDPRASQRLYYAYQNVNLFRSDDFGSNATRITSGLNDTSIFIMPFILDPNLPDRLYAGRHAAVAHDQSWHELGIGERTVRLAVRRPRLRDRGVPGRCEPHAGRQPEVDLLQPQTRSPAPASTSWQSRSPRTGWVSSLAFDPVDANVAYATYSTFGGAHVWRSADAGQSWSPLDGTGNGQLPDLPVNSIVIDPQNTAHLYIGTDLGVFASLDGGQHWAVENTGFANVITEMLQIAAGETSPRRRSCSRSPTGAAPGG